MVAAGLWERLGSGSGWVWERLGAGVRRDMGAAGCGSRSGKGAAEAWELSGSGSGGCPVRLGAAPSRAFGAIEHGSGVGGAGPVAGRRAAGCGRRWRLPRSGAKAVAGLPDPLRADGGGVPLWKTFDKLVALDQAFFRGVPGGAAVRAPDRPQPPHRRAATAPTRGGPAACDEGAPPPPDPCSKSPRPGDPCPYGLAGAPALPDAPAVRQRLDQKRAPPLRILRRGRLRHGALLVGVAHLDLQDAAPPVAGQPHQRSQVSRAAKSRPGTRACSTAPADSSATTRTAASWPPPPARAQGGHRRRTSPL